ncbi:MAG TPA: hypothetical protein VMX17_05050 [Candidatus Glassbacteria bacterium]|nr:hypothetical protein [Candidatus Glassbacteria bacterium]
MELGNAMFGNSRGEFPIERGAGFESELSRLFDAYAPDRDSSWREYGVAFENDTFSVFPYYWGECDCDEEHEPDCPELKPNFLYKPTGFEIEWYKYPLRDSYSNQKITLRKFVDIIDECIKSLE